MNNKPQKNFSVDVQGEDETVSQILENAVISDKLLQMRVVSRSGSSREITLAIMKFDDTWYCTSIDPNSRNERTKLSRSKKSLRTALNREIKRFLDAEGFDDSTPVSSLKEMVSEDERREDEAL